MGTVEVKDALTEIKQAEDGGDHNDTRDGCNP